MLVAARRRSIQRVFHLLLVALAGAILLLLLRNLALSPRLSVRADLAASTFAASGTSGSSACQIPSARRAMGSDALRSVHTTPNADARAEAVAQAAAMLAQRLSGSPDTHYTHVPAAVLSYWQCLCPQCVTWQNDHLQCGMFVVAAFAWGGEPLPAVPNSARDFWPLYAHDAFAGWSEVANGSGFPAPGDLAVLSAPDDAKNPGHVAVVTAVYPPQNGRAGAVVLAEANGPAPFITWTVLPDTTVLAWPGMQLRGFVRLTPPPPSAPAPNPTPTPQPKPYHVNLPLRTDSSV